MDFSNFTQELIQFIFGAFIGYVICINLYTDIGNIPNFAPNIPLLGIQNGHQYIGSIRIHHWMWGVVGLFGFMRYDAFILSGLCFAFMIHGLSYDDCFDFDS